ncbi:hypothetical protein BH20ACT6_BH20ACT6_08400 [soil metagenome]
MMWSRARRSVAVLATVAIAVLVAFVAMNVRAASAPSDPIAAADRSGAPEESGSARAAGRGKAPKALVERIIDGLEAGKKFSSFDNPTAGTFVLVVAAEKSVPVGRLSIGRMKLRTPFLEGVHQRVINKGPGHWPGTPLPGQPGNAVISGHRATHGAEFVDLDLLQPGDEIVTQIGGRQKAVTYSVRGTTIVPEKRYVPFVLEQPKNPNKRVLTLFACNPKWDSTERIVVRAEATSSNAVKGG